MDQILGSTIGAFLGVVAGIIVMMVSSFIQRRSSQKQEIRNLCFELHLNVKKIDRWLKGISTYRNAVNGDSLHTWHGYFDLSKTASTTANSMFASGLLYNALNYADIESLQTVYWELSLWGENYINEQFENTRTKFLRLQAENAFPVWLTEAKPEAVRIADFWEAKLTSHRATLVGIAEALDGSSTEKRAS